MNWKLIPSLSRDFLWRILDLVHLLYNIIFQFSSSNLSHILSMKYFSWVKKKSTCNFALKIKISCDHYRFKKKIKHRRYKIYIAILEFEQIFASFIAYFLPCSPFVIALTTIIVVPSCSYRAKKKLNKK